MKKLITILFLLTFWVNTFSQVNPSYEKGKIIKHAYYTVNYCQECNAANYSFFVITKEEMSKKPIKRTGSFKKDPQEPQVLPTVYNKQYDRGHLASYESMAFCQVGADECFYMTNIVPQIPNFNRGLWKKLEEKERKIALQNDSTWIVAGCIYLLSHKTYSIDNIWVPDYMYKVISTKTQTICYLFPNKVFTDTDIEKYKTTLDDISKISGVTFNIR